MPWRPRYRREQAASALRKSTSWKQALDRLGLTYRGKNIATLQRWALRWGIDVSHIPPPQSRPARRHRYTEAEARAAIAASRSWAESLRRLGYCHSGGNPATLRKRAAEWGISTEHFDPHAASNEALQKRPKVPLDDILVPNSTYSRTQLKQRLYDAGLKRPVCELCGQGDRWRGRPMGLILDHVNGVRDDNRLENLQVVCPNCAATLDTHCGRKNRIRKEPRECLRCGREFMPKYATHRYCSRECGTRAFRPPRSLPARRKVERPPEDQLLHEIEELGYLAVGRKYGVSDNAVRKWLRAYARERAVAEGRDPDVIEIPTRTWPNRRDRKRAA